MKRILAVFVFIFLTGLFAGLFFGTGLSQTNGTALSSILLENLGPSCNIPYVFFHLLATNFILILIMLPAIFTSYLSPLPPAILFFKGFTTGFCCCLIYMSSAQNPFLLSLIKLFPQNIFFIPAFILASVTAFYCSVKGRGSLPYPGKNRPPKKGGLLLYILAIALALVILGGFTGALLHQAVL